MSKPLIKVISTILVVIVLGGGYYLIVNYSKLFGSKSGDQSGQIELNLGEIKNDFSNRDKKSSSGVTPPQAIIDRYEAFIVKSRQAIQDNKPSDPTEKDLAADYVVIANSQMILGRYDEAEQSYLTALEKYPDNYRANMNLGDLYILMDLQQNAAVKFFDTIKSYPKDAMIYTKLADLYFKYSKAPEKAQSIYELGWKNADDKRLVLDYYLIYLKTQKKDMAKWEEINREYEKITGSKEQQRVQQIEQNIDMQ